METCKWPFKMQEFPLDTTHKTVANWHFYELSMHSQVTVETEHFNTVTVTHITWKYFKSIHGITCKFQLLHSIYISNRSACYVHSHIVFTELSVEIVVLSHSSETLETKVITVRGRCFIPITTLLLCWHFRKPFECTQAEEMDRSLRLREQWKRPWNVYVFILSMNSLVYMHVSDCVMTQLHWSICHHSVCIFGWTVSQREIGIWLKNKK